jgi:hypothetical protein
VVELEQLVEMVEKEHQEQLVDMEVQEQLVVMEVQEQLVDSCGATGRNGVTGVPGPAGPPGSPGSYSGGQLAGSIADNTTSLIILVVYGMLLFGLIITVIILAVLLVRKKASQRRDDHVHNSQLTELNDSNWATPSIAPNSPSSASRTPATYEELKNPVYQTITGQHGTTNVAYENE